MKKQTIFLLILILLLATYLRVSKLDLVTISTDELGFYNKTRMMVEGNGLIINGISAEYNEAFGPLMFYLLAIPMSFSKNYLSIVLFMAIINILAVLMCFIFTKRFFNERVALIASALFAVSPWAIFYSRILFNIGPIPLFSIIFFYSLFSIVVHKKQKFWILLFASYALLIQIHLSTLAFAPLFLGSLFYFRKNINWKYVSFGFLFLFILLSPFVYYNLTTNLQGIKDLFLFPLSQPENTFMTNFIEAVGIPFMLATNYFGKYMFGSLQIFTPLINSLFVIIASLIVVLLILGLFFIFMHLIYNIKKEESRKYLLLLLWMIVPVFMLIIRNKNIGPHYYEILFPLQFIVIGSFIDKILYYLKKHKKDMLISTIKIFIVILVLSQAFFWVNFMSFVDKNGGTNGTYGVPYKYKLQAIDYIIEDSGGNEINFVFYKAFGEDYDYLFSLRGIKPNYVFVDSFESFKNIKNSYVVIDTFSRYGLKAIGNIKNEEVEYFNALEGRKIKNLVVVDL